MTLSDYLENHREIYNYFIWNSTATLREESSQTNIILQYKLLAAILSAVCSIIQRHSMYFYLVGNYMMGNMIVKLSRIRPYFS